MMTWRDLLEWGDLFVALVLLVVVLVKMLRLARRAGVGALYRK